MSADGERISAKTTAMMGSGGHVTFNVNSLTFIDRVIVLRVNTEEMHIETLLNAPVADAISLMSPDVGGKRTLALGRLVKKPVSRRDITGT